MNKLKNEKQAFRLLLRNRSGNNKYDYERVKNCVKHDIRKQIIEGMIRKKTQAL